MTRVSVIIPVYNVEEYLENTLTSLKNQSFTDAEFICIDDGSTDKSLDICNQFVAADSRFKVISQANGGPAKARNTGIDLATGEFICFVDSDDYLEENALDIMYSQSSGYDIIVHSASVFGDYDKIPEWINKCFDIRPNVFHSFNIRDIFTVNGCRPFLWQHFIRTSILKDNNIRIDEQLEIGEDQAFEVAYFSKARRVLFIPDRLYRYRINRTDSIMSKYENKPWEKLNQHCIMLTTIINTIQDNVRESDELVLLEWIIELTYWDLLKLLYTDQVKYLQRIIPLLESLNIEDNTNNLKELTSLMYRHMRIMYDYQGNPEQLLNALSEIDSNLSNRLNKITTSIFYRFKEYNS